MYGQDLDLSNRSSIQDKTRSTVFGQEHRTKLLRSDTVWEQTNEDTMRQSDDIKREGTGLEERQDRQKGSKRVGKRNGRNKNQRERERKYKVR